MDCLNNLVGLRDCSPTLPKSGLFVNDLPGMSTELLDKIADQERLTYAGVWERVKKRAKVRLLAGMRERLVVSRTWKEILYRAPDSLLTRGFIEPNEDGILRGVQIGPISGAYAQVALKAAIFYAAAPSSGVLRFFSLADGQELLLDEEPLALELVKGYNRIELDKLLPILRRSPGYFIAFDGITANLFEHDADSFDPYGAIEYVPMSYKLQQEPSPEEPVEETPVEEEPIFLPLSEPVAEAPLAVLDLESRGPSVSGWGMALEFDVVCSAEAVLCANSSLFEFAWLNLLGAEILTEKINSPRVNWATAGNRELTDENIALFEGEYKRALAGAVKSLPASELCVECSRQRAYPGSFMMP